MPVSTRSSTRTPPTSRSQHSYSLRENRPVPGFFADMQNDDTGDMFMAAEALMMLSASTPNGIPIRRSARIAGRS